MTLPQVAVFSAQSWQPLREFEVSPGSSVEALAFSPCGSLLALGVEGADALLLYDTRTWAVARSLLVRWAAVQH